MNTLIKMLAFGVLVLGAFATPSEAATCDWCWQMYDWKIDNCERRENTCNMKAAADAIVHTGSVIGTCAVFSGPGAVGCSVVSAGYGAWSGYTSYRQCQKENARCLKDVRWFIRDCTSSCTS